MPAAQRKVVIATRENPRRRERGIRPHVGSFLAGPGKHALMASRSGHLVKPFSAVKGSPPDDASAIKDGCAYYDPAAWFMR